MATLQSPHHPGHCLGRLLGWKVTYRDPTWKEGKDHPVAIIFLCPSLGPSPKLPLSEPGVGGVSQVGLRGAQPETPMVACQVVQHPPQEARCLESPQPILFKKSFSRNYILFCPFWRSYTDRVNNCTGGWSAGSESPFYPSPHMARGNQEFLKYRRYT